MINGSEPGQEVRNAKELEITKLSEVISETIADVKLKVAHAECSSENVEAKRAKLKALLAENEKLREELLAAKGELAGRYGIDFAPAGEDSLSAQSVPSEPVKRVEVVASQPVAEHEKTAPQDRQKPKQDAGSEKSCKKPKEPKKKKETVVSKAEAEDYIHPGRLDFRVGKIVECDRHPDADSLYVEKIDLAEACPRTIVSGLVKFIPVEEMRGRLVIVLCNLKPAKMRGITSEGMVMCASTPEKVEILIPPEGAVPGDVISFAGFPRIPDPVLNPKRKVWETLMPDFRTGTDKIAKFKDVALEIEGKEIFIPSGDIEVLPEFSALLFLAQSLQTMNGDHSVALQNEGAALGAALSERILELPAFAGDPKNQDVMGRLCGIVTSECRSEDCLRNCVHVLHRKCLENRELTRKFARFCAKIQGFKVGDASFRNSVLDQIELDFKARGLNRDKCYAKFVNSMVLLCEILTEMRLANGSPIPVLSQAALGYLFNFIDEFSTEDSIIECCRQIQRIGQIVEMANPETFAKFIMAVKEKLIECQRLSSSSKACLAFIVDFAGRRFTPFPKDDVYTRFYASKGVPLAIFEFADEIDPVAKPSRKPMAEIYRPPHVKLGLVEPSVVLPPELAADMPRRFLASDS